MSLLGEDDAEVGVGWIAREVVPLIGFDSRISLVLVCRVLLLFFFFVIVDVIFEFMSKGKEEEEEDEEVLAVEEERWLGRCVIAVGVGGTRLLRSCPSPSSSSSTTVEASRIDKNRSGDEQQMDTEAFPLTISASPSTCCTFGSTSFGCKRR